LAVNHDGVAIVAAPGAHLLITDVLLTTFEFISNRVAINRYARIDVTVYRPGSESVQSTFFD
jgi:hypothetical protein